MASDGSEAVRVSQLKEYADSVRSGGGVTLDQVYPVGSIYLSVSPTDPGTLFGGTWQRIQDAFLLAAGSSYEAGTTGGSADAVAVAHSHTATAASNGAHNHDVSVTSAGSHTHSNSTAATGGAHTHTISGGSHSHTASTNSAGGHTHGLDDNMIDVAGIFPTERTARIVGPEYTAPYYYVNTTPLYTAGAHTHTVTVATSSSHSHTIAQASGHTHSLTIASGGSHTHAASADSAGAHAHSVSVASAGQSGSGANMPPYLAVYVWQRTA